MKIVTRAPYFMLALALIGIAVAFYDSYAIYNRQPLWCPSPIDGCNIVADSPYAHLRPAARLFRPGLLFVHVRVDGAARR